MAAFVDRDDQAFAEVIVLSELLEAEEEEMRGKERKRGKCKSWQEKVALVQSKMAEKKAEAFIVTALDEVAFAKLKCVKNAAEIEGMKLAQVKDAVALCEFMLWLEKEVGSYPERVCYGPNGEAVATQPSFTHFTGHMLDTLARTALWDTGLDYCHGTGHGVGAFLNVHEGPCGISSRVSMTDIPLEEGMILSDEPGFYEDGSFGVRIENCVLVTKAETKYNFRNRGFLTFEPITYVPIQTKMIDPTLLTEKEISWLDNYHSMIRTMVGQELQDQGKHDVYMWLLRNTEPLG
nr:hypothetical protein BaRGS_031048 [Batillaria attramentaria]